MFNFDRIPLQTFTGREDGALYSPMQKPNLTLSACQSSPRTTAGTYTDMSSLEI